MDYPSIVKNAFREGPQCLHKFAHFMRHLTNGFLIIYQMGSCCIYVVFIAENIKAIVDDVIQPSTIDKRLIMIIVLLPLILINWVNCIHNDSQFQNTAKCYRIFIIWVNLFVFAGSEFEIFGAIFNDSQLSHSCFIRYYLLFHFPWSDYCWRQARNRSNWKYSVFHWNGSI